MNFRELTEFECREKRETSGAEGKVSRTEAAAINGLADAMERYLQAGGKVTAVPEGVMSGLNPDINEAQKSWMSLADTVAAKLAVSKRIKAKR